MSKEEKPLPTFARPLFAKEIFKNDFKEQYDNKPGWFRHYIAQAVKHGDLKRAALEAQVPENLGALPELPKINDMKQAMMAGGIHAERLVKVLGDCLDANLITKDKHGNIVQMRDLKLALRAAELSCKLLGYLDEKKPEKTEKPNKLVELFKDTDPDAAAE